MEKSRLETKVGLFVLIGLALLVVILWIGRRIFGRRRTTAAA